MIHNILTKLSVIHLNVLLLLGLALFGGTMGGKLFQKIKIPQVVGYIIIGIIVGQSGLNLVDKTIINIFQPLNYFALGLIGFMIGGELKKDIFKKYGKQFVTILLFEGIFSFLIVFIFVGVLGSLLFKGGYISWALGLLLGAMASATAPAATTDVLWEAKTKGPLTTTVLGLVAMDDGLALFLFAIASSIAAKLLNQNVGGLFYTFTHPICEIFGAIALGVVAGILLTKIIKSSTEKEKILALALGTVLFVLGLSLTIKVDMLVASMTLGLCVVNLTPRLSKEIFKLVNGFATPIYVLFFVLVGAKLNVSNISISAIILVSIYLIGRTMGKMSGAYLGAKIAKAPKRVQRYLPFCLFSQAGVAIGLSIVADHLFPGEIGTTIIIVITTSTFVVQLIGPSFVKYAVTKAGEIGLNITEEDLIRNTSISAVMDKNFPKIYENMPLTDILKIFSSNYNLYYPVLSLKKELAGVITIDSVRQTFMESTLGQLLVARDIMEPVVTSISPTSNMLQVKEVFEKYNLDYLPIVSEKNNVIGFLERRTFARFISTRLMEAEQKAISLER
ncbi:MAG: cation:proton antiporter [Candidatus Omnitrophota bacterium]